MNDPLQGSYAREDALVEKWNIFRFLSDLTQFKGNLKISYNSIFFSKKRKNGGGWGPCNVSCVPTIKDMNYPL